MESFIGAISSLVVIGGVFLVILYIVRHRGRLLSWINNINHQGNAGEKEEDIIYYRRRIEDAERKIRRLENHDTKGGD